VIGFSPELRAQVNQKHLRKGRLFGAVLRDEFSPADRQALIQAGWEQHNYKDKAVLVPPSMTVAWDHQHAIFRDHMLHATAHRLPEGIPAAGNAGAILEELIASAWEEREDQLRTVLSAFSFASLLPGPDHAADPGDVPAGALDAATAPGAWWERHGSHDPHPTTPGPVAEPPARSEDPARADRDRTDRDRMEGYETFFFYAASMRDAARAALEETVRAPDPDDGIWELVEALQDARFE
jgi:hypothetical protein